MMTIDDVCREFGIADIGDFSDGYHTFNSLYRQRAFLFATIVKQNRERAWKSLRHEDGELCFGGGWFIVGVDTPKGTYTHHYDDNLWSLFDCQELPVAKHWDGHTDEDVDRLLSLDDNPPLTWEELSGMKGKPVYIENIKDHKCFCTVIVCVGKDSDGKYMFCDQNDFYGEDEMGKKWNVYRQEKGAAK